MKSVKLGIKVGIVVSVARITSAIIDGVVLTVCKRAMAKLDAKYSDDNNVEDEEEAVDDNKENPSFVDWFKSFIENMSVGDSFEVTEEVVVDEGDEEEMVDDLDD